MSRLTALSIIAMSLFVLLSAFQLGRISHAYAVAENPGAFVSCSNCNSAYNPAKGRVVMECQPEVKVVNVRTYVHGK